MEMVGFKKKKFPVRPFTVDMLDQLYGSKGHHITSTNLRPVDTVHMVGSRTTWLKFINL